MENFDLASQLRLHRERLSLNPQQMAEKMAISEYDYKRLENGTLQPEPEAEKKYLNFLALEKYGIPPPQKWYRSRRWHWVIPIIISLIFICLHLESAGYQASSAPGAPPPFKGLAVLAAVFCAIYWCIWKPEWPFKK